MWEYCKTRVKKLPQQTIGHVEEFKGTMNLNKEKDLELEILGRLMLKDK